MPKSVRDFSLAFAATVQQSLGWAMRAAEAVAEDESMTFEWVIVDEAARVSPHDLMIALEQGKRTILGEFGDHRQLPQILDEEVADRLERGEEGGNGAEWARRSVFEYLFAERLKSLEEQDNIPRRGHARPAVPDAPDARSSSAGRSTKAQGPGREVRVRTGRRSSSRTTCRRGRQRAAWMDVRGRRTRGRFQLDSVNLAEVDAIAVKVAEWMTGRTGPHLRRHLLLPGPGRPHPGALGRPAPDPGSCWSGPWKPAGA